MSTFGVKYESYFYDQTATRQSKIQILEDGYTTPITQLNGTGNPIKINVTPTKKFGISIFGREVIFSIIATAAQTATYDEFLTDEYKKKKLKYFADGTNLTFVGWLQPANCSRQLYPVVQYDISATDGFADLKNVDYTNAGILYEDRVSGLTIIKRCLALIGIDDCDIFTQINIYETALMTSSQNPLVQITHDNRCFNKISDGATKPTKAYDVIEDILNIYHCKLFQENGYWNIVNDQEYNSYRIIYNYSDLTVKTAWAANDRSLNIDSYLPIGSIWEMSKIQPLKILNATFRNKNLAGTLISNGDFSGGTTGWTNVGFESFTAPGGYAITTQTDDDTNYFTQDSTFSIGSYTSGDTIKVQFKVKLVNITFSAPPNYYPAITCKIVLPDTSVHNMLSYCQNVVGSWITLEAYWTIAATGNYNIQLGIEPYGPPITYAEYDWDDVIISHEGAAITTFDKVFIFTNNAIAYQEDEMEVVFGDSLQTSDQGSLQVGSTLTILWCRYGKSETIPLIWSLGQQIINDYQALKNFLKVSIYDPGNNISFGTVLIKDSKYYRFENFSKDYRMNIVSGDIYEILNTDAGMSVIIQQLTTSDGE